MRVPACLAALLLPACQQADPDFGHSIRQNRAIQIVDDRPLHAGLPIEGSNGVRLADAQRRYLAGRVKELLKVDGKSSIGVQGGASDSSAGAAGTTGRTGTP